MSCNFIHTDGIEQGNIATSFNNVKNDYSSIKCPRCSIVILITLVESEILEPVGLK